MEVVGLEIESWSASHYIGDHLHQPLLFKWINDVLVALHVSHRELNLLEMESCFAFK